MKHLVLGAGGFLGQHLVTALASGSGFMNYDAPVTAVDREWRTYPHTPGGTAYAMSADVCDAENLRSINWPIYDTVWHLAALNDATQTFYDRPWDVLNTQIRGTLNVIDACVANGVKTLVLFSSSEVFADAPMVPTPEAVPFSIPDPHNPRFSYAASKQAAEMLAWYSAIPRVLTLRPFNAFGPGQRPGHVVIDLIDRIATAPKDGQVEVRGDSRAYRAFCYVDDFIKGALLVERHHSQDERTREVYHIGDKRPRSMLTLANAIAGMLDREDVGFTYTSAPPGSPLVRCPDTTKIQALGWGCTVPFTAGLERTIAWYREQKK